MIPRATADENLISNRRIFSFELSQDEMDLMNTLDDELVDGARVEL